MFVIIGIVVVFGCVVAGYLMEHGNLKVLVQPAELVIIGGAALGTLLIANPLHILKAIVGGLAGAFGSSKFGKDKYLDTMKMMYELFSRARKEGLMALEADSDGPDKSPVFSKYPKFLKRPPRRSTSSLRHDSPSPLAVRRTLRYGSNDGALSLTWTFIITARASPLQPSPPWPTLLPGLGMVAAVPGVVITMGAIGGPPADRSQSHAAALVGTFLGILLCYGPIGAT